LIPALHPVANPGFMARYADAVVSHQCENSQNYLYCDVCGGGGPLATGFTT